MKKVLKKLKTSILFYTFIYIISFILIKLLLNHFNLEYMQWIYYASLVIVPFGIIAGTVQLIRNRWLLRGIVICIEAIILFIMIAYFSLFLLIFQEEVVNYNNKMMVKLTCSFLFRNDIRYYDYENIFIRKNIVRIYEEYEDSLANHICTTYYDENGKRLYTYTSNGEIEVNENKTNNSKEEKVNEIIEENGSYENLESTNKVQQDDILYQKNIDGSIIIRIVYKGSVLGGRSIIVIEKTIDGGATWNNQLEMYDGYMQIHIGTEYIFIDENIGFIYDYELTNINEESTGLLVTTNGGKTFIEAKFDYGDKFKKDNFFVSGLPYIENGILKIKIYTIDYSNNREKIYYEFYSEDNGVNWKCM